MGWCHIYTGVSRLKGQPSWRSVSYKKNSRNRQYSQTQKWGREKNITMSSNNKYKAIMRTVVYLSNSVSTKTHRMNPSKKASGSSGGSFLNFVCGPCFLSVFGNLQHHFPQRIHTWRIRRGNGERGVCLSLSSSSGPGWAEHSGASDRETGVGDKGGEEEEKADPNA